jgi:hypothetical protein
MAETSFPYSYANIEVLSYLWGCTLYDAKARFGASVLWRDGRAEVDRELAEVSEYGIQLFSESGHSYEDAVVLARAWESSIGDAKTLIGKRKLQGQDELTNSELANAQSDAPNCDQ